MSGNAVKIAGTWYPVTDYNLWQACKTEEEYFQVMAQRQKKGSDFVQAPLPEKEEPKQITGTLF